MGGGLAGFLDCKKKKEILKEVRVSSCGQSKGKGCRHLGTGSGEDLAKINLQGKEESQKRVN